MERLRENRFRANSDQETSRSESKGKKGIGLGNKYTDSCGNLTGGGPREKEKKLFRQARMGGGGLAKRK